MIYPVHGTAKHRASFGYTKTRCSHHRLQPAKCCGVDARSTTKSIVLLAIIICHPTQHTAINGKTPPTRAERTRCDWFNFARLGRCPYRPGQNPRVCPVIEPHRFASHLGDAPGRQVLIERRRTLEHAVPVGDIGGVPVADGLIERRGRREHEIIEITAVGGSATAVRLLALLKASVKLMVPVCSQVSIDVSESAPVGRTPRSLRMCPRRLRYRCCRWCRYGSLRW
jgi:hypothetical protein